MLRIFVLIALLIAPVARAGCRDSLDGPTRCFDRLGRYPIEQLNAAGGVTIEELTKRLGKPLTITVQRQKDPDYPVDRLDHEVVTLRFPHRMIVLSRRVSDPRFWLERYELEAFTIPLKECVIQAGQSRRKVLRALGFKGKAAEEMIWHHQWCEGDLAYEEWATVTPHFDADGLLRRISWDYWAD